MMAASIADNLRLGNVNATRQDMEQALRHACAWDFVSTLPNGLDTILSEGGKGLSHGQAQRLSIARALLRKAPVLILDEATSDLDPDTEAQVLQNLSGLGITCILATHRSSVLARCSKVCRIQDGILTQVTT